MHLTSCRISYSTTGGLFFYCPLDEEQSIRADPLRECLFGSYIGADILYSSVECRLHLDWGNCWQYGEFRVGYERILLLLRICSDRMLSWIAMSTGDISWRQNNKLTLMGLPDIKKDSNHEVLFEIIKRMNRVW